MVKEARNNDASVVSLRGASLGSSSFDLSIYAQFWREASQAVAMSRKGKVHLVARVEIAVLRGLHAEAEGAGPRMGKMPIAVVCKDAETIAGPMLRGLVREESGWRMGDGSLVKFFDTLPGPEEGERVDEVVVQVSPEARRDLEELQRVLQRRKATALKKAVGDD